MFRNLLFLVAVLILQYQAFSQCDECYIRSVVQYNIVVEIAPPSVSGVPLDSYIKMLRMTDALAGYFMSSDPGIGCIAYNYLCPMAFIDSSNYSDIALGQVYPPENTASLDYYIYGTITGEAGGYYAEARLALGATQETIAVGGTSFDDSFDPEALASQVGASMISLYARIMDFEKEKRDGGEPYAITPTISLEPEKKQLDFGEQTPVHLKATDCDGEPLKNRTFNLTVDGGLLDVTQVQTNDQGESFVIFTAGGEPTIAVIQTEFSYTAATEKEYTCSVEPAVIQIRKPEDAWFITGKFRSVTDIKLEEDASVPGAVVSINTNRSYINREVSFAAWINRYPIPQDTMVFVTSTDYPLSLRLRAREFELDKGTLSSSGSNWYQVEQVMTDVATLASPGEPPVVYVSIADGSYGFGLSGIFAMQDGYQKSIYDSYDPIDGKQHSENQIILGSDTYLDCYAGDTSADTSYSIYENDPLFGTSTTQTVEQTFYWDNQFCVLNFTSTYLDEQDFEQGFYKIKSSSYTKTTFRFSMSYNGSDPNAIAEVWRQPELAGNCPNPFKTTTNISFTLPEKLHVRIDVFDFTGKKCATLINEEQGAGDHYLRFDGSAWPAGIYFYRLAAGNYVKTGKMVICR